ncbi:MAG: response regulator [Spirochaetales bacterium]|nr:response regulator [Spirochaetales bacterium]
MNQLIAGTFLSEYCFSVEVASDGTEAVRLMEEKPAGYYDVILMDIQMPVMDGHEASRRIRAFEDRSRADIPIIAITANAFNEEIEDGRSAGMTDHDAKPIDVEHLKQTLYKVLSQHLSHDK